MLRNVQKYMEIFEGATWTMGYNICLERVKRYSRPRETISTIKNIILYIQKSKY